MMDFDDILPHIGSYGKFQILMLSVLAPIANIPCGFTYLSIVFVSATPDHWCFVPELEGQLPLDQIKNISIPLETIGGILQRSNCMMYDYNYTQLIQNGFQADNSETVPKVPCKHGWSYDRSSYKRTLVTDMDVVCDKRWLQSIAESSFFIGTIIGSIVFGNLGNIYGRKPTFYVLMIFNIIGGVLSAFTPNYIAYIVYRAIVGTTSIVIFQIPFIVAMEMMGPLKRSVSGMFICSMFPFTICLVSIIAYLTKDWFILSLVISFPMVIFLLIWYFIPESARWLLTQNRIEQAEVICQKIAKMNKKQIQPNFLKTLMASKETTNKEEQNQNQNKTMAILHIAKYPNIRKKFLIISYGWLVNAIVYVGLLLGATMFPINDFLSVSISGLVELPGVLIAWWAMDRFGRRTVLFVAMVFGGISCVCSGCIPADLTWTIVILANIGKMGIAGSYSVIYCFGSELFPTVLRTFALAAASLVGSIGAITAPHILYLGTLYGRAISVIILGTLSITGGISTLFLPETLGTNLPETLEEGEAFGKDDKFWSFPWRNSQSFKLTRRVSSVHRDSKTVGIYDDGLKL